MVPGCAARRGVPPDDGRPGEEAKTRIIISPRTVTRGPGTKSRRIRRKKVEVSSSLGVWGVFRGKREMRI